MKMSTLLYFTGPVFNMRQTGGIKRFVELSKYYRDCSKDYLFCTQDEEKDVKANGFENFQQLRIPHFHGRRNHLLPELQIALANYDILKLLKKKKFSKVIVFDVPTAISLCLLGFRNIILMIRKDMIGYEFVSSPRRSMKFYLKLAVQWLSESICLSCSKKIVVQCDYDAKVLCNRHFFLKNTILKKTFIQINNVNPSWAKYKGNNIEIDDICLKICFIGNFDNPRKGHDLFLKAVSKLSIPNLFVVVIGGGANLSNYQQLYHAPHIKFLGHQNNPINELCKCNLLVVPSLADSCPNTIMEALLNNVPVIGSRAGGIPEILNFDEALFDLSVESLVEKITLYYQDEDFRYRLVELEKLRREELTFDWASKISDIINE